MLNKVIIGLESNKVFAAPLERHVIRFITDDSGLSCQDVNVWNLTAVT